MNKLIKEIESLISLKTTSDKPEELQKAINYFADKVRRRGYTVELFDQNNKPSLLAYRGAKRPEKFSVILNGHIDVVPAKENQFEPKIIGDKLYGRGAVDMKAAAIVLTEVFCNLAEKVPYELGLQIVSDEEVGGHSGTLHQINEGVEADFVIAGEFTPRSAICTESKGICWLEISLPGTSAHSAYLWNGDNSLLKATDLINKLLEAYPVPSKEDWVTTVNVANLATFNKTFNRVPDVASVSLDVRFVPGDKNFKDEASIKNFFRQLEPSAKVKIKNLESDHRADEKNSKLTALAKAVEKTTKRPAKFIRKHGASDVRHYCANGTQAVVMGLQGEGLHSDNEYINIKSIEEYYKILTNFLQNSR